MRHLKRLVRGFLTILLICLILSIVGGIIWGVCWLGANIPPWLGITLLALVFAYSVGAADE